MLDRTRPLLRSRNTGVAVVGIAVGAAYLVIGAAHDQLGFGLAGLGIVLAYLALLHGLRRRSETAELLSARPADERQQQVVLRATALTGSVLICAVVIGMLVSLAADAGSTAVFTALSAAGGVTFMGATAFYSRHT